MLQSFISAKKIFWGYSCRCTLILSYFSPIRFRDKLGVKVVKALKRNDDGVTHAAIDMLCALMQVRTRNPTQSCSPKLTHLVSKPPTVCCPPTKWRTGTRMSWFQLDRAHVSRFDHGFWNLWEWITKRHRCAYICIYTCMHVYTRIIYVHVLTYAYVMFAFIWAALYIERAFSYIHTYIHTYIHNLYFSVNRFSSKLRANCGHLN